MNALRSIGIALFVHLLGGCPGTTETDAGLDAALADAPLDVRVVDDITHIDAPLGDVSTSDAPSDAGSFDGGDGAWPRARTARRRRASRAAAPRPACPRAARASTSAWTRRAASPSSAPVARAIAAAAATRAAAACACPRPETDHPASFAPRALWGRVAGRVAGEPPRLAMLTAPDERMGHLPTAGHRRHECVPTYDLASSSRRPTKQRSACLVRAQISGEHAVRDDDRFGTEQPLFKRVVLGRMHRELP
jgi:hypothetical protein